MAVGRIRFRAAEATLAGRSHVARRVGCDDAASHRTVRRECVLIALADGAGSARHGAVGARYAVQNALAIDVRDELTLAAQRAREGVEREAHLRGCSIDDLATTLQVARLTRHGSTVSAETLHIGDGVIAASAPGGVGVLSAPERGEHANETAFLTTRGWQSSARLARINLDAGGGIVLMSDGPMAALYDARRSAMAPACKDILAAGIRLTARRYERALLDVLCQLRETTIDDLSIACAVVIRD